MSQARLWSEFPWTSPNWSILLTQHLPVGSLQRSSSWADIASQGIHRAYAERSNLACWRRSCETWGTDRMHAGLALGGAVLLASLAGSSDR